MIIENEKSTLELAGISFSVSRPHRFGLVINGPNLNQAGEVSADYLNEVLLAPDYRDALFDLVEKEGLVVCRNVRTESPTYRRVRGKSSAHKLSQAEYYHHDGCSSPTKPRVVEIRFPDQAVCREIATAIAPFPDVMRAMLLAIPEGQLEEEMIAHRDAFSGSPSNYPPLSQWDSIQGRVTRMVRRVLDAESCRSYFREVDRIAGAYHLPWEMGESRLMLNNGDDLTKTVQHRRAYQKSREATGQSGSLVKRWPVEDATG